MHESIFLAVLFPLVGFLLNALFSSMKFIKSGESGKEFFVGAFSTLMIVLPFVIAVGVFFELQSLPASEQKFVVNVYEWFKAGAMTVGVSYQLDSLSVLMMLVVTGVGSLIHLYSIGYMHGDEGFARFFSYLNLFIFAMLNLVLADNMALMFLGWEGVGLCSYFLIGFWYDRKFEGVGIETTTDAANKAFMLNRVGDFAMLGAMFLIFQKIGSLTFESILSQLSAFDQTHLFWIALLVFIGCTGKSAQIPLFTWLPDAMAGPTPVSALIHAATMVTSGIYLIARLSPLFMLAPDVMTLVAIIGAATAIIAASIAVVQNDIKKILAYSTVSQLGYMFLALGVGATTAAMFHLVTHAFFKACLFLGSGSVIHALHEEQDVRQMGGLQKVMPSTGTTFLIGAIALSGFPLTAGFFSKDEMLAKTFASGNVALYAVGIVTAALTAFYSMRAYALTFLGDARWAHDKHPHESGATMTIPLWILAALSLVGGVIGLPAVIQEHNWIHGWLSRSQIVEKEMTMAHSTEWILLALSSAVAIGGLGFAYSIYTKKQTAAASQNGFYNLLLNKYYIDELYNALFVKPVRFVSEKILPTLDAALINGVLNGVGTSFISIARSLKVWQSGVAQNYALAIIAGLVAILSYLMLKQP